MKKLNLSILSVIGILVLVVFASGCTSSNNTSNSSSSNGQSSQFAQPNGSPMVKVIATGPWQGSIMDSSGSKSVQGTGPQTFPLAQNPGNVIISFSKSSVTPSMNETNKPDTSTLTVQIVDSSGNIVATKSTSAEMGNVAVSHQF